MNNIKFTYFFTGLLFIANAVYGLVTGNLMTFSLELVSIQGNQASFYINLVISCILGGILLYRSFMSVGNNRHFHEQLEQENSQSYYEDCSVDPVKLIKITLVILFIFAIILIKLGIND